MAAPIGQIKIDREFVGHAVQDKELWVPPNQRDYSWKEKHVDDLYSDLALVIGRGEPAYFLGSIVVISTATHGFMVVDGQQRLATSVILLAAIRDFLDKSGGKAREFEKQYILKSHYMKAEMEPRLRLNERDHQYFFQRVLLPTSDQRRKDIEKTKPSKASHVRIDKAAKIAAKRVKEIAGQVKPEYQIEELHKWVKFLEEGAQVIWVVVPDESSAYVIFETMNDRGLELSATDLIKNYMFGRAGDSLETVKHNWLMMTGALETVSDEEIVRNFVRHYWISRYGIVRKQEMFDALKAKVTSKESCVEYSADFSRVAPKYVALMNPLHDLWSQFGSGARNAIRTLSTLGVVQSRPLLLAALEKLEPKEVSRLLLMVVSWTVRLLVAGTHGTGALEALYGETAQQTRDGKLGSAAEIAKKMSAQVPRDEKFQEDFREATVSSAPLARYYLRAMERQEQKDPEPYFIPSDDETITLEHVMPEDRLAHWSHISEEVHETFLRRIGNLCLLRAASNSGLGNVSFKSKRDVLRNQQAKLTQMVGNYDDWGPEQIEDRQRRLAEIAVSTWPTITE